MASCRFSPHLITNIIQNIYLSSDRLLQAPFSSLSFDQNQMDTKFVGFEAKSFNETSRDDLIMTVGVAFWFIIQLKQR